ncbi:MAG TPA: acyl-CoA dehydrogenase family protein [Acidimicrobiales bacterium]|jgi:alkylation response protein AidB-like acyl-CoA dehydrogenase|nr:acyl-CoA dehydrogenase family protein [Acidimicrobiales bacterium]
MDFDLSPELLALREEALEVGRAAAARQERTEDTWLVVPDREFSLELARRGWIGMTWPTEVGGGGRSAIERFVVYEALLSTGAPLASSWFADRQMGPSLLQFGTPEQQERYLPQILDGTSAWSIGMSEPDAGSDVASIRTRAVRDGDHFVVNGQKIWNSGAAHADLIYLVCRTDPDAKPHLGMSELIVDMHSPGISVVPIKDMTTSEHFCEVWFEDVRVPAENLVGQLNGSFGQLMKQLEHERGGADRLLSNRRLYKDCLAVADTSDPLVRQEIAAIETGYRIGRLLVLREVLGQAPKQFSAATKTFCTELEQRIATFCAGTLGAYALIAEPGLSARVARNVCYAPAYTIMGGTSNILRNILGERVLGLPR